MDAERIREPADDSPEPDHLKQQSAVPGKGGLARIAAACRNTLDGLREGFATEAAIKQEVAVAALALPLSFLIAETIWIWVALIGSLLLVFTVEFLNTAVERLCNHLHPDKHEAIKATKDLASAGVSFALALAGLVWGVAILSALGLI